MELIYNKFVNKKEKSENVLTIGKTLDNLISLMLIISKTIINYNKNIEIFQRWHRND